MFDIHTHLLPCLDDGPDSLEASVELINKTLESGMEGFFATPHYIRSTYPNNADRTNKAIAEVKKNLDPKYKDIQIIQGAEIYLEEGIHKDIKDFNLNMGSSKYVMIESNRIEFPYNLNSIIYDILMSGYTPILCHPERYHDVIKKPGIVEDFMFRDTLIQVNLASLTGQYGKPAMETAWDLIDKGHVHFLATDNHGKTNPDEIDNILNLVSRKFDQYTVDLLTSINPHKIINNEDIKIFYLEKKRIRDKTPFEKINNFLKSIRKKS